MSSTTNNVAVIGAGPAGLMAAEVLAQGGARVMVYDAMPSAGRKFLMAGRGGLNLTHSEPLAAFLARYREASPHLTPAIEAFPPERLRTWSEGLSQPTASLPVMIYTYAVAPYEDWHQQAWSAGFVLLTLVLAINIIARTVFAKNRHVAR